jgi:hypothetical protein
MNLRNRLMKDCKLRTELETVHGMKTFAHKHSKKTGPVSEESLIHKQIPVIDPADHDENQLVVGSAKYLLC